MKGIDFSILFLYIIRSGCAVESRDAHSPGSSCVSSFFTTNYIYRSIRMTKSFFTYEQQLHQLITIIARNRNVCAHGERLYSFKIRETIPDMPLHSKLNIPKKNGHYIYGKNDLFAVVIALRYLLSNEDFKIFKRNLLHLINSILKKCPHISKEQLFKNMGFPENWDKISKFKKF